VVDRIGLVAGELGEAAGLTTCDGRLNHAKQSEEPDIEGQSVGDGSVAIAADDSASRRREINTFPVSDARAAAYADAKLGHEPGLAQQIKLECEEGFLNPGRGQVGQQTLHHVEYFGVRIVFLQNEAKEFDGIDGQIKSPQTVAERKMAILQLPVGEEGEVARIVGEDGMAGVEEIDAAVESACAGFGLAMGALGHDADDAKLAREEGEDLRGFAVFGLAETDAAVGDEGHIGGL